MQQGARKTSPLQSKSTPHDTNTKIQSRSIDKKRADSAIPPAASCTAVVPSPHSGPFPSWRSLHQRTRLAAASARSSQQQQRGFLRRLSRQAWRASSRATISIRVSAVRLGHVRAFLFFMCAGGELWAHPLPGPGSRSVCATI